jgi:hypothetical protein
MKNYYLLILVLCLFNVHTLSSQTTVINQENLPHPYDTFVLAVDLTPTLNLGDYAQGQSWDFTSLNEDLSLFACYGNVADLDFAGDFPTAHIYTYGPSFLYGGMFGASPDSYGYLMFATDPDGYKIVGYRSDFGFGMTSVHNTPFEALLWTPAEYDDEQNSYSNFEIRFEENSADNDTIYRRSIYKNLHNCAEGDLTTPYGFFPNVLNVKETAIYVDSIFITFMGTTLYDSLVMKDTVVQYNFWSTEHRHPVAIVETDFEGNQQQARYLSWEILSKKEIANLTEKPNISIFPNPTKNNIYFNGLEFNKKYTAEIYDITGKMVLKKSLINTVNINISKLSNSMYIIRLSDKNSVVLERKFIKN